MIALAGTVALIMLIILMTKLSGSPRRLPIGLLVTLAAIEVAIVFFYMSSLEVPVR